ncbi:LysM peptidoglycan-binding domain-containing protein [Microcoleus sp. F8_C2]
MYLIVKQSAVNFGFTGGVDNQPPNKLAKELKVNYFLRLQPYLWNQPNLIEFSEEKKPHFNFDQAFHRLAYKYDYAKVSTVPDPVWQWYAKSQDFNTKLKESTSNAETLVKGITNNDHLKLWPIYGLNKFEIEKVLFNIILTALYFQENFDKKPIIIALINPITQEQINNKYIKAFSEEDENLASFKNIIIKELLEEYFTGQYSLDTNTIESLNKSWEETTNQRRKKINDLEKEKTKAATEKEKNILEARLLSLKSGLENETNKFNKSLSKVHESIELIIKNVIELKKELGATPLSKRLVTYTTTNLEENIKKLEQYQVLIFPLGFVPQEVYNCLYSKAKIPGFFEGQGTSSLVISQGIPFFQVSKTNIKENNYPSILLLEPNKNYEQESSAAKQNSERLINIRFEGKKIDIKNICEFINNCLKSEGDDVSLYFKALRDFFQQDIHDKLMLGLVALKNEFFRSSNSTNVIYLAETKAEEPLTLKQVYEQLNNKWKDGNVNLVDAFPKSYLTQFYSAITTDGFFIKVNKEGIVAQKDRDGNLTQVSIQNASTVAFGTDLNVQMDFVSPSNVIVSNLQCRSSKKWDIDGIPWIGLENAGFNMRVTELTGPVEGEIVGKIAGTSLDVQIKYPIQDNKWVMTSTLGKPYPSITSFYQLAGGINLVQSLPSPLNTLSGFGLSEVQFIYDATKKSLAYMLFIMETDSPWIILSNPKFEIKPQVHAVIYNPGDTSSRHCLFRIFGSFTIGNGIISVKAQYPNFELTGELTDGEIQLSDLVKLFGVDIDLHSAITDFSLSLQPSEKTYFISATIESDWSLKVGSNATTTFTITGLSFKVSGTQGKYTVFLAGSIVILPNSANIGVRLAALYLGQNQGWELEGKQTSGAIALAALLKEYLNWDTSYNKINITELALTIETATNSFEFSGTVDGKWEELNALFGDNFEDKIAVKIGYNGGRSSLGLPSIRTSKAVMPVLLNSEGQRVLLTPVKDKKTGWFGEIKADIKWNGIDINVFYDFEPSSKNFGITWGSLTGKIEDKQIDKKTHKVATLKFTESTTLGSMVEIMVFWATGSKFGLGAPWNILDSIILKDLSLTYDFTDKKVYFTLDISPIELGFARIESVSLSYNSGSAKAHENGVFITLNGKFFWQTDPSAPINWDATKPEQTPAPPGGGNKYFDLRSLAMGQHVTSDCFKTADTIQKAIACMASLPETKAGEIPAIKLSPESSWLIGADFGVLKLTENSPDYFLTLQIVFNDPYLYGMRIALDGKPAKIFAGLDFQLAYRQIGTGGVYQAEIALPPTMRHLTVGGYKITLPVFNIAIYTNGDFQLDMGFPWNFDFSRSFRIEAIIPPGIPMLGSGGLYFGKLSSATTNRVPTVTNGTFNPVLIFGFGMQVGLGKSIEAGILRADFSLTIIGLLEGVIAKWNPYQISSGSSEDNSQIQGEYYFWLSGTLGIAGKLYGTVDFSIIKATFNVEITLAVQVVFESYAPIVLTIIASVDVSASISIDVGLFTIHIHFSFSMRLQESFTILTSGTAPWQINEQAYQGILQAPIAHRLRAMQEVQMALVNPNWSNLKPADKLISLSGYLALGLTVAGDEATELSRQQACYVAMLFIDSVLPTNLDDTTSRLKAAGEQSDTSFEVLCKQVFRWAIASLQSQPLTAAEVDRLVVTDDQLKGLLDYLSDYNNHPIPISVNDIEQFLGNQFLFSVKAPSSVKDKTETANATYFPMALDIELEIPGSLGLSFLGYKYTFAKYNSVKKDFLSNLRTYFDDFAVQIEGESQPKQAITSTQLISDNGESQSVASFVFSDYFLLICRQMLQAARDSLRNFKYPIKANKTASDIVQWVNETGQLNPRFTLSDLFIANPTHKIAGGITLTIHNSSYTTVTGDTLQSIASRFGIAIADIANDAANCGIKFDSAENPYLDLPHLPKFQVAELIAEIQRSLALQHLSGMVSRYYLHGLRLSTQDITPKANGMWVGGLDSRWSSYSYTVKQAGLYALTGQQFPIHPGLSSLKPIDIPLGPTIKFNYKINFTCGNSWLVFQTETSSSVKSLTVKIDSSDMNRVDAVRYYATNNILNIDLQKLGLEKNSASNFATYPLTSSIVWCSATSISLPYGNQTFNPQSLHLWLLPDALIKLPDPAHRSINPRFALKTGRYDEATGVMVESDIANYGWASTIEFTIKKVAQVDTSPATRTTYEIIGTSNKSIVLMEKLLSQVVDNNAVFANLILGYPLEISSASKGLQTDDLRAISMGIAQVNLSTETHPSTSASEARGAAVRETSSTLFNQPSEFIRQLWEASITRRGGFYLYYYNVNTKGGLPDSIFNDKDEASVTLIVLYSKPSSEQEQNQLTNYMNAVAIGENIDLSRTVVFAKSNPLRPKLQVPMQPEATIHSLAYQYYSDIADLAEDNANLRLASNTELTVNEGVYQVSPEATAPGGSLASIASYFNTTDPAIRQANPRIENWSAPLPPHTAIRLPQLKVSLNAIPSERRTLGAIAAFYGTNLVALAAHNQDVPGLFATGQHVTIAGGPTVRSTTVPLGVLALEEQRLVPPNIPANPSDANYGEIFLKHIFSLLAYQVTENADFKASNMGLPLGPTTDRDPGDQIDKIQKPKTLTAGDSWTYKQVLPYSKFLKGATQINPNANLPDLNQSPYLSIGRLLQLDFMWLDIYGNKLKTQFSRTSLSDVKISNQLPILIGYTDAIIGLGQWPSISSGWQVLANQNTGKPQIQLLLSFDDSRYQGLISAKAINSNQVEITFTQELDKTSAKDKSHYSIDNQITVEKVELPRSWHWSSKFYSWDQKTVRLTVSNLANDKTYTLTVNNVKTADSSKITFDGQASFTYPNNPSKNYSSLKEHALQDIRVYTQLWYQLKDPNGVAISIKPSFLQHPTQLSNPQFNAFVDTWLKSIYLFIGDRANGGTSVPLPPKIHTLNSDINIADLNPDQIFKLSLSFTIERVGGTVMGDLATTPNIRQVSTSIAPYQIIENSRTLGLQQFAQNFENALSQAEYKLKVATGIDRHQMSNSSGQTAIWAVRVGLTSNQGISYSITNQSNPSIFAPRPISNQLETRKAVPIYHYKTGTGIDSTHISTDFINVDMDDWGRQFLSAIDAVLSPEFTVAIQIVGNCKNCKKEDYLAMLLKQKQRLANIIKKWMIPVFDGNNPTLQELEMIQDTFKQQLLEQLSNAYTIRAGIEFQANVNANIQEGYGSQHPPLLYGSIIQNAILSQESGGNNAPASAITLTSPKLKLQTNAPGPPQHLAFLLTAPDQLKGAGNTGILPNISLNLTYSGAFIEHQIGSLPKIEDYLASSWLSFVLPETSSPLKAALGQFQLPMVLRAYPTSPTMSSQSGVPTAPQSSDLGCQTQWTYRFTYALPFHYPQDRVYCRVEFNNQQEDTTSSANKDLFSELAEFITVFPEINKDLKNVLAKIDITTTDQNTLDKAKIAADSFLQIVTKVADAAESSDGLIMPLANYSSSGSLAYEFSISEGSVKINQKGQTVDALLVIIHNKGNAPAGIDQPQVLIDPTNYNLEPYSGKCSENYCYVYKDKTSQQYLVATKGQSIAERQVVIPGLNVLVYQDARSSAYIKRNEELIPNKVSAAPFIYQTAEVSFPNSYTPIIDSETVVDISTIGSTNKPPQPISRPLDQHLKALFEALLKGNTQESLIFQVEINYDYTLNAALDAVRLPVIMQAPLLINVQSGQGSSKQTLAQMITDWTQSIQIWFTTYHPKVDHGVLWFDLTIMSNLTKQPMPLLQLRQLKLPIHALTSL